MTAQFKRDGAGHSKGESASLCTRATQFLWARDQKNAGGQGVVTGSPCQQVPAGRVGCVSRCDRADRTKESAGDRLGDHRVGEGVGMQARGFAELKFHVPCLGRPTPGEALLVLKFSAPSPCQCCQCLSGPIRRVNPGLRRFPTAPLTNRATAPERKPTGPRRSGSQYRRVPTFGGSPRPRWSGFCENF